MDNENKTIHDFDFNLICDYFKLLERQGPGSPAATLRALGFIDPLTPDARAADLGCGTGGQTMVLAENLACSITGLDLFPGFIEIFNTNASKKGFGDRVHGVVGSMDDLPFEEGSLDLIWAEGSIYNIGYEKGLRLWNRYLKPGGMVAVSEATWFTRERPEEIGRFWEAYPEIDTIPVKIAQMEDAGYLPVAHFVLPDECWTKHFFAPQALAMEKFLATHPDNETARIFIENMRLEPQMFERHHRHYGYVFYIGRKV